jgi:predicted transposase/invertase (TIGR01784 family)
MTFTTLEEVKREILSSFLAELRQYEQERAMPYVTSIEQMAKAEGKAEERLATQTELALKMLQEGATVEFVTRFTGFTADQLQQMQADAANIQDAPSSGHD